MSLQLTMINNKKHATPIKVKSPKLVTRISLSGKMRLLCILCRFLQPYMKSTHCISFIFHKAPVSIPKGLTVRKCILASHL